GAWKMTHTECGGLAPLRQRRPRERTVADEAPRQHADHQQRRPDWTSDERLRDVHGLGRAGPVAPPSTGLCGLPLAAPSLSGGGRGCTRAPGRSWFCPSLTTL